MRTAFARGLRGLSRHLLPAPALYLLLAVPFAVVFWLIPLTLYAHAGEDWDFRPILLAALAGLGLALYLAAVLLLRLGATVSPRLAHGAAIVLFGGGVAALLAHVYAPIPIGPLDGEALASNEPLLYSVLEVAIVLAVALVCWQLMRGKGLPAASWFAALLLAIGLGYQATLVIDRLLEHEEDARQPPPVAEGVQGNVYQIVLDAFQTDALLTVLERHPELREQLSGFALYRNNTGNYITTRTSFASYMTGSLFRSGKYGRWLWSWRRRGLLADLAERGYAIWMYVPFSNWDNKFATEVVYNVDIYERQLGFAGSDFYDFLQVWLASLAPTFLTNEVLEPAGTGRDWLFALLIRRPPPLSVQTGIHPYAGVQMLRQLQADERARPDSGQYVYAHAALPHGPSVMNPECRYVGRPTGKRDDAREKEHYLYQGECAMRLVAEFLGVLKELGRYEDATIIVQADHGRGFGMMDDPRTTRAGPQTLGHYDRQLLSKVNAMLMVKPPQASGPLTVQEEPTQLVDIYPTLVRILGLPEPRHRVAGRPVDQPGPERDAIFGFDPEVNHGPDIVDVRIADPTDLPDTRLEVLGPADRQKRRKGADTTAEARARP